MSKRRKDDLQREAQSLGRPAIVLDVDAVVRLLRTMVELEGGQTAFAGAMVSSAQPSMPFYPVNGPLLSPLQTLLDFGARTPPSEFAAMSSRRPGRSKNWTP